MKKIFALPLLAMAVLGTSAYTATCESGGDKVLCDWGKNGTACWYLKSTDDAGQEIGCETQAGYCGDYLYKGTEASGNNAGSCSGLTKFTCNGCSWGSGANIYCDYGPIYIEDNKEKGGCWDRPASDGCGTGGTEVTKQQCDARNDAGVNTSTKFCYWEGDGGTNQCYCGLVDGQEATAANCSDEYGEIVTSCTGKCGSTPVLKFTPASLALTVAPFGRSLHISSARDATVSLYDMSGAKVYSGKVRAGNSVFSLERVSSGSYYAVVQSGSDAKKVPVVLK